MLPRLQGLVENIFENTSKAFFIFAAHRRLSGDGLQSFTSKIG
jgi:hypothetical protein